MYKVILIAEDGTYVLTDVMSEASAIAWIARNKCRYGEGQRLALEYAGPYFGY
jgi:hypothetical protein